MRAGTPVSRLGWNGSGLGRERGLGGLCPRQQGLQTPAGQEGGRALLGKQASRDVAAELTVAALALSYRAGRRGTRRSSPDAAYRSHLAVEPVSAG